MGGEGLIPEVVGAEAYGGAVEGDSSVLVVVATNQRKER